MLPNLVLLDNQDREGNEASEDEDEDEEEINGVNHASEENEGIKNVYDPDFLKKNYVFWIRGGGGIIRITLRKI